MDEISRSDFEKMAQVEGLLLGWASLVSTQ